MMILESVRWIMQNDKLNEFYKYLSDILINKYELLIVINGNIADISSIDGDILLKKVEFKNVNGLSRVNVYRDSYNSLLSLMNYGSIISYDRIEGFIHELPPYPSTYSIGSVAALDYKSRGDFVDVIILEIFSIFGEKNYKFDVMSKDFVNLLNDYSITAKNTSIEFSILDIEAINFDLVEYFKNCNEFIDMINDLNMDIEEFLLAISPY